MSADVGGRLHITDEIVTQTRLCRRDSRIGGSSHDSTGWLGPGAKQNPLDREGNRLVYLKIGIGVTVNIAPLNDTESLLMDVRQDVAPLS